MQKSKSHIFSSPVLRVLCFIYIYTSYVYIEDEMSETTQSVKFEIECCVKIIVVVVVAYFAYIYTYIHLYIQRYLFCTSYVYISKTK